MNKIKVFFDKEGNTLDVWFEEPREVLCEETGDEVILKKDPKTHKVIGFEKLNYVSNQTSMSVKDLPIEVFIN
jgi:hypothetical protein